MTQSTVFSSASSLPDVFSSALVELFAQAQPSIVQVSIEGRGGGTGVIWHEDGRIITNAHVVAREHAKVHVLLADGRKREAQVLHRNPRLDLAVLKIDDDHLTPLSAGDSAQLRVGEWVFAIGHPWGERWVLTAGIVSSHSTIQLDDSFTMHYIKSDVGLAPGNSGGPLLNADGNVVGINAMIFGGDLSVAIPSNVLSTWLAGLTQPQSRMFLDIQVQAVELSETVRQTLKLQRTTGVLVVGIGAKREAKKHNDLLVGDILLAVADTPVTNPAELRYALEQSGKSKTLPLHILRGGTSINIEVATILME